MMQKTAVISSSKDPAGVNIRNSLVESFGFKESNGEFDNNKIFHYDSIKNKTIFLYLIEDDLIFSENIDRKIDADSFIFASKHRSKENTPSFAVHPIGNWGKAELGGKEKTLCFSSSELLKNLFVELNKAGNDKNYEITMEATHHGPYVEKPAVFIEIGSTEKEWNDKENGKIIAETIMNALKSDETGFKTAIGIGGPHYCNNFNKIVLRGDIAISHICPKYQLENFNGELIKEAIGKTKEKAGFILLDWKGLGKEKQRILELLKEMNLEYRRADQILK